VSDQGRYVVGHRLVGHGTVYVGGVAVRLEVDGDDLSALGKLLQVRAEHLARSYAAVEQDQRFSVAVYLVVQLYVVYWGVSGLRICACHFAPPCFACPPAGLYGRRTLLPPPIRLSPRGAGIAAMFLASAVLRPGPALRGYRGLPGGPRIRRFLLCHARL
jgi:hypothetical protein